MIATQSLAGVAPEVNLRSPVTKHATEGTHPGFETRGRQKGTVPPKIDT